VCHSFHRSLVRIKYCLSRVSRCFSKTCTHSRYLAQCPLPDKLRYSRDVLFGLVGDGFVLLVSDTSRVQSIVVQRTEVDKIVQLDGHKLMVRLHATRGWRCAPRRTCSSAESLSPPGSGVACGARPGPPTR